MLRTQNLAVFLWRILGGFGGGEPVIRLANEFTEVVVERVRTRNGARLRISVPSSGQQIMLCPLELEALAWQDHELFSALLKTPHGPED